MKRIIIAEDDQAISEVVKIILEGEGYITEVVSVENVLLHKIFHEPPNLLLLDIWLDGSDGGKIAQIIRDDVRTAGLPIIIVSANNQTEEIARSVGANDFLQKPFNIDDLLRKVDEHIA